jgi:leucyl aminopeptidase
MNLKINYLSKFYENKSNNITIFLKSETKSNDLFKIFGKDKHIVASIEKLKKKENFTKKKIITSIDTGIEKKIIVIWVDNKLSSNQVIELGAKFFDFLKNNMIKDVTLYGPSLVNGSKKLSIEEFVHGAQLKSYNFDIYKTSNNKNKKDKEFILNVFQNKIEKNLQINLNALLEGTYFSRDLVSEPGNILTPDEYAKRLLKLKKHGLKITVYDEKKLKKLGMNALLGVGQGSVCGSYLVTIEWNGLKNNSKPLAFIGKGVCFDTGGISLKPARFMEEMTYDMAGSAVVAGLMKNFALRKAKINAVGVVGLVENMPGGNAQRPGDIVKSYSGKTIEILNTDAEGRLVLADALTFTEKKFKPNFIVDLATLTGAIIVCLGEEYAGLFSNNDNLSKKIIDAGNKVDEKVWRMPLHKNYDKLMNSKIADVQNINYSGGAGSITAAQFLQRFIINKTPWAHLDIAGMAFSKKAANINPRGATGYGVRLLNKLVEENYE